MLRIGELALDPSNGWICSQQVTVVVDDEVVKTEAYSSPAVPSEPPTPPDSTEEEGMPKRGNSCYRLEELAFLRSGDKGNSANIGDWKTLFPEDLCECDSL